MINLLKKQIEVIDDYLPNFLTNIAIVEHINEVKDRDAIFFTLSVGSNTSAVLAMYLILLLAATKMSLS